MSNSSVVEGVSIIIEELAASALNTARQGDLWTFMLFFLAMLGFTSLAYAIFNSTFKGLKVVSMILFIPAVFIVSMFNRSKRKERLREWGELKRNFKGKKSWKWYVYLVIKLGIPLVVIIFAIKFYF